MRHAPFLATLALSLSMTLQARAQHVAEAFVAADSRRHSVRAYVEMDPAIALGLGYVRALDVHEGDFERRIAVHVDATAVLGFSSWDLGAGAAMRLVEQTGFDVLIALDLESKIVDNDVHSGFTAGYGAALRPGYFDPTWYAALDLSLRGTFAAALFHSTAYRELFPQVQDGVIATDHLNLFAGVAIGFCIEDVVLIGGRFVWRVPRTFEDYAPYYLPYTLDLEVGLRF